ncbi:eIF-2-alpha kinase GCN2-like [Ornithodoros turicata]|uniref:eIF-2-alpha kinase GCN2-like n=1 Tax=Ornithodoros turicata TaxID=34597 RepID=UPI0031395EE7
MEQQAEQRQEEVRESELGSPSQGESCNNHGPHETLAFEGRSGKTLLVSRGACIGHSSRGCVVFAGIDLDSGTRVSVVEWTRMTAEDVAPIERELQSTLLELRHPALLHYLGSLFVPERGAFYLLQEFARGSSLRSYVSRAINIDVAQLRSYLQGILQTLAYLHEHSVAHQDLRDSDVFIDGDVVRVANYSLPYKLAALCHGVRAKKIKGDVYQLGLLAHTLVKGQKEGTDNIIPSDDHFQDFLRRCSYEQEEDRWSCDQLLPHPFIIGETSISPAISDVVDFGPAFLLSHTALTCSRLQADFDVLGELGRGGFGRVFKVRSKLDRRTYALKRVKFNARRSRFDKVITREVKILSRLDHPNIVRYYDSWTEVTTKAPDQGSPSVSSDSTGTSESEHCSGSTPPSGSNDDEVVFEASKNKDVSEDETPVTACTNMCMFILQEYCEYGTLRNAIDNNLYKDPKRATRYSHEILAGLDHIHGLGIIHRDVKPDNVLITMNDTVKIADFGLAVLASAPGGAVPDQRFSDMSIASRLTGGVGTPPYRAPELEQTGVVHYTKDVDMYSFGVTMVEMFSPPMLTAMERQQVLGRVRNKLVRLPAGNTLTPYQQAYALFLLLHNPAIRPSPVFLSHEDPNRTTHREHIQFNKFACAVYKLCSLKMLLLAVLVSICCWIQLHRKPQVSQYSFDWIVYFASWILFLACWCWIGVQSSVIYMQGRIIGWQSCIIDLQSCFSYLQGCFSDLQGCFSDLQGCFSDLQGCFSDLQGCSSDPQGCFSDLEGCFIDLQSCFSCVQGCFSDLRGCSSDLQGYFIDLQGYFICLQGCLSDLQRRFSDLQGCLSDQQGCVSDLRGCFSDLQDCFTNLHACFRLLQSCFITLQGFFSDRKALSAICAAVLLIREVVSSIRKNVLLIRKDVSVIREAVSLICKGNRATEFYTNKYT